MRHFQGFKRHSATMKYRFSVFTLDTASKEISAADSTLKLSRQGYEMLLLLVENPGRVFSRDELVREVWRGRHVTGNSVDQCISKLRKTLADVTPGNYIETVYGKGLKFVPAVVAEDAAHENRPVAADADTTTLSESTAVAPGQQGYSPRFAILMLLGSITLAVIAGAIWRSSAGQAEAAAPKAVLLLDGGEGSGDWSVSPYLDQVLSYANAAQVKMPDNSLSDEEKQHYLERRWRISPAMQVVSSRLEEHDGRYAVTLELRSSAHPDISQRFSGENFSTVIKSASRWLAEQLQQPERVADIQPLIPDESYLLELYMRGLSTAKAGKINKAAHFLGLCLEDKPDFHLARLELADVISKQGKPQEALALLDTLPDLAAWPQVEINAATIRGDILDTQGKYQAARKLYLQIIDRYAQEPGVTLDSIRYNFSYTLTSLQAYEQALEQLETLKSRLEADTNPELLAHVYQKIGSIQQTLGQMQAAAENADQALALFSRLEDLPGKAKVLNLLARIANHQSEYNKAAHYLRQSLQINRSLDYKLGVGATLNELIYVLMVQGHFRQASELNQQMQDIALEIDHTNMLLASKQLAVDIARSQNQWVTAKVALDAHLALAKSVNSERAVLKNKLLSLDFYLDQKETGPVLEIVEEIQQHIEKSGEDRLRPRLQRQLARYYLLSGDTAKAMQLLHVAKKLAMETNDGETLTEIGHIQAEYYLDQQQPDQALAILVQLDRHQPLPHPHLLLKSRALALEGKTLQALEVANLCKQKANGWWSSADEKYLASIRSATASSL